jgi:hypothetical protein
MRISEEASEARTEGLTLELLLRAARNARYASAAMVTHNKMITVEIGMVVIADDSLRVVHLASVSLRQHHAYPEDATATVTQDAGQGSFPPRIVAGERNSGEDCLRGQPRRRAGTTQPPPMIAG